MLAKRAIAGQGCCDGDGGDDKAVSKMGSKNSREAAVICQKVRETCSKECWVFMSGQEAR